MSSGVFHLPFGFRTIFGVYFKFFPTEYVSRKAVFKKMQAEKEAASKTSDIARHDKITRAGRTGRLPSPPPSMACVPL